MTKRPRKKREPSAGKGKKKSGFFGKYRVELLLALLAGILFIAIYVLASGVLIKKESPPLSPREKLDQKEQSAVSSSGEPRKVVAKKPPEKSTSPHVPIATTTPSPASPPPPPASPAPTEPIPTPPKGRLAIIIDDLGGDMEPAKQLAALNAPIAFAILPHLAHSRDIAEMAHKQGFLVMSHLPMEAKREALEPGPGGLLTTHSMKEIEKLILEDFNSTPHIAGVNNHMGSLFTEDAAKMEIVMREIKRRGLFFVDSKTSPSSVGVDVAVKRHVPTVARDVFLDNERDKEKIVNQILTLARLSMKRGKAVGIGHPYPETIEAIGEALPKLKEMGVEVVPVTETLSAGGG